jgi:hypothetical protein
LVVTGFFSQAVARKLIFYYLQDNFPMIEWIMVRFAVRGVLALALGTLALFAILVLTGYDRTESLLGAAFMAAAGLFQLSLAPLYTMRRFVWLVSVGVVTALATALVYRVGFGGKVVEPWEPLAAAGTVALAGIASMLVTFAWLHAQARKDRKGGQLFPPRWKAIAQSVRSYQAFGALYFLAIVVDHVGAGLLYGHGRYTYNPNYELGADIGLLAIVPLTGLINVILERLPPLLLGASTRFRIGQEAQFNAFMRRYFTASLCAFGAVGVVSYIVLLPIGLHLIAHASGAAGLDLPHARLVLYISAVAYVLLVTALFASQVLFFLSSPQWPLAGIVAAVAIVAGVAAWAVLVHASSIAPVYGLLAGMIVFCCASVVGAYRAVNRFAYSYYASY